jgi:hypothetical protein
MIVAIYCTVKQCTLCGQKQLRHGLPSFYRDSLLRVFIFVYLLVASNQDLCRNPYVASDTALQLRDIQIQVFNYSSHWHLRAKIIHLKVNKAMSSSYILGSMLSTYSRLKSENLTHCTLPRLSKYSGRGYSGPVRRTLVSNWQTILNPKYNKQFYTRVRIVYVLRQLLLRTDISITSPTWIFFP